MVSATQTSQLIHKNVNLSTRYIVLRAYRITFPVMYLSYVFYIAEKNALSSPQPVSDGNCLHYAGGRPVPLMLDECHVFWTDSPNSKPLNFGKQT